MRANDSIYIFNLRDGTYSEGTLLSMHGGRVMVEVMGQEYSVGRSFVTKDPGQIKELRMAWENVQANLHGKIDP